MREAMQEKEPAVSVDNSEQEANQSSTNMEIQTLKLELENVKSKMAELHDDYSELQREYEKLSHNNNNNKPKNSLSWSLNWRKIKKSFHAKPDGDETVERSQDKPKSPNPSRLRSNSVRRVSMS